jgi:hypothetical protein
VTHEESRKSVKVKVNLKTSPTTMIQLLSKNLSAQNCRLPVSSWSNGIFTDMQCLYYSMNISRNQHSMRSVDSVKLHRHWTQMCMMFRIVLPEVIVQVVIGLFSPQCFGLTWISCKMAQLFTYGENQWLSGFGKATCKWNDVTILKCWRDFLSDEYLSVQGEIYFW